MTRDKALIRPVALLAWYPVTCTLSMEDQEHGKVSWMDLLWLAFLVGLAAMPPIGEIHKQLILLGIGLFQILEGRLLRPLPATCAGTPVSL